MPGIEFKPIEIADLLKLIGALTVFALGLYQYARAQKWKRGEFIAAQIKEFEANKDIQIMMTILDWTDRKVYFPSEAGGDPVELRVDDQVLCSALLPHEAAGRYDRYEVLIRDRVDRFLEMLVRLKTSSTPASSVSRNCARTCITGLSSSPARCRAGTARKCSFCCSTTFNDTASTGPPG